MIQHRFSLNALGYIKYFKVRSIRSLRGLHPFTAGAEPAALISMPFNMSQPKIYHLLEGHAQCYYNDYIGKKICSLQIIFGIHHFIAQRIPGNGKNLSRYNGFPAESCRKTD